jgi:NitT/TauT family transport system substrate-binding protein
VFNFGAGSGVAAKRLALLRSASFAILAVAGSVGWAAEAPSTGTDPAKVRIGVLAYGTVNWELAAIDAEDLARSASIVIVPTILASAEAAKIALQGNAVDVIVADWIWVARQRVQGADYTFSPYSTMHGSLVVPAASSIRTVGDLKGKRLGVVGGGLDKNWLLLKLLAKQKYGIDPDKDIDPVFGAPPLLNQQLVQGRLDALLDYWHYAAKLEVQGYRTVLDGRALLGALGVVDADLANLGFVFRDLWANQHLGTLRAFLGGSVKARSRLCGDDSAWQRVIPLTQESDPKITSLLRQRYCEGGIQHWGEREVKAAERLFGLLHEAGGEDLTGKRQTLPPGVFWAFPQ